MTATIIIKKDREKPIRNQHPWIFSGAIDEVRGNPTPGEIVTVVSHNNIFLGRGYWNSKSQIQVRMLTWQDAQIDEAWWRRMLKRAVDARDLENLRQREQHDPYGFRVINAENDYIPGLIVDRYGDWLILQALTLYIDQHKALFAQQLADIYAELHIPIKGIYERSDVDIRKKEGMEQAEGMIWGEEPPKLISMTQDGLTRLVDVRKGHKTGYYLDQLGNQEYFAEFLDTHGLQDGANILNLFSYTGGFGLGTAGHVINVDASREVLELAEKVYAMNDFPTADVDFIQADVFEYLRDVAEQGQQFDVVICDPPKFANSAQQVERAARGYKDLNLNAFKLIKAGGYLMTFSCSGAISRDLFQKIVFGALADTGRQAQIIQHLSAGEDHPVALTFPEGEYLKGLLLRVY